MKTEKIMKSKNRRMAGAAAAVFFGVAVVVYVGHGNFEDDVRPAPITNRSPGSLSRAGLAAQAPGESVREPENRDRVRLSDRLLSHYNTGAHMRSLVDEALRHPEDGGYFYASRILKQCQASARGTSVDSSAPTAYVPGEDTGDFLKRANAAERLRMRCADFLDEETADSRTRGLWKSGETKDPLIRAVSAYASAFERSPEGPGSAGERKRALENLLRTNDPLALEDTGLRLALRTENGKRGFQLGDTFHDLNSDTDVGAALYLLPCGLGLRCDETEFDVTLRCASGGDCDTSRFRHIERMLQTVPGGYARVMAAYQALVAAAREANAGFFTRG